jgi:hypothetical protein
VYNFEVEGDHCYRVGQQGILVHNASVKPNWIMPGTSAFTTFAQPAAKFRGQSTSQGLNQGEKTLAVLVYVDAKNAEHTLPTNMPFAISGGKHAEQQLLDAFNKIKKDGGPCFQIMQIFVERTPCDDTPGTANRAPKPGCDTKLSTAASMQSMDIWVYFLAASGTTNSADALLTGYKNIGLYNMRTGLWYGQDGFDAQ